MLLLDGKDSHAKHRNNEKMHSGLTGHMVRRTADYVGYLHCSQRVWGRSRMAAHLCDAAEAEVLGHDGLLRAVGVQVGIDACTDHLHLSQQTGPLATQLHNSPEQSACSIHRDGGNRTGQTGSVQEGAEQTFAKTSTVG